MENPNIGGVPTVAMMTLALGEDDMVRLVAYGKALGPDGRADRSVCYQLVGYGMELLLGAAVEERILAKLDVEGGNGGPKLHVPRAGDLQREAAKADRVREIERKAKGGGSGNA